MLSGSGEVGNCISNEHPAPEPKAFALLLALQDAHRDRPVNLRDWLVVVQHEHLAAFFETLVAGADEYNKAKVGRTALLDAVYKDVKPEAAHIGRRSTCTSPTWARSRPAINNGQLTATSVNPNYIPLVFQTRAGAALQFQDFEQWQTAVDLAQLLDGALPRAEL